MNKKQKRELRKDKDLVKELEHLNSETLEAVKNKPIIVKYARKELRNNLEVMTEAISRNKKERFFTNRSFVFQNHLISC